MPGLQRLPKHLLAPWNLANQRFEPKKIEPPATEWSRRAHVPPRTSLKSTNEDTGWRGSCKGKDDRVHALTHLKLIRNPGTREKAEGSFADFVDERIDKATFWVKLRDMRPAPGIVETLLPVEDQPRIPDYDQLSHAL